MGRPRLRIVLWGHGLGLLAEDSEHRARLGHQPCHRALSRRGTSFLLGASGRLLDFSGVGGLHLCRVVQAGEIHHFD